MRPVERHRFEVRSGPVLVPGYLWTEPGATGPRPLVLLGYGATSSKDGGLVTGLGRLLASELGFAAAAIDFPFTASGARKPSGEYPRPRSGRRWAWSRGASATPGGWPRPWPICAP